MLASPQSHRSITHSSPSLTSDRPLKRKRSHFALQETAPIPDFISLGILSEEQAIHYFHSFFEGCDRYVPIFDASDTFSSIRSRCSLLLNAVCAVGSGVSQDSSVDIRLLHFQLKRWLTTVILSPRMQSVETVQALLVSLHINILMLSR